MLDPNVQAWKNLLFLNEWIKGCGSLSLYLTFLWCRCDIYPVGQNFYTNLGTIFCHCIYRFPSAPFYLIKCSRMACLQLKRMIQRDWVSTWVVDRMGLEFCHTKNIVEIFRDIVEYIPQNLSSPVVFLRKGGRKIKTTSL